ncbi:MAG: hypothetical protein ROO76_09530 [Terriglobia bacterium]|jgi:hypothetical protein|nr:hypothetical protein [Terriglobia bacterium]
MSSLVFYIDENQAYIATDTLAVNTDGTPLMFTSKAFVVPHLKLILAGVGAGGFLGRWFVQMSDRLIAHDIDNVDYHAPSCLRPLWQGYKHEFSIPDGFTTTVYHYGFSKLTGKIHAYAYRSASNFESERLTPYGLRYKPECEVPAEYNLPADLPKIMTAQRAAQAVKPKEERLYIGGEIQTFHLTKDGFGISTVYRFDDYEENERVIFGNCIPISSS